jgi:ribosomal protein S18 acetylase RimI-like enzyme
MDAVPLQIVAAGPAHVSGIVEIERACPESSTVVLTAGEALREAMSRGHGVAVAIQAAAVLGWAWWHTEDDRAGETTGVILRVAVAPASRRRGIGAALVAHAASALRDAGCARLRARVPGDDPGARAMLERAGFHIRAVEMEAP